MAYDPFAPLPVATPVATVDPALAPTNALAPVVQTATGTGTATGSHPMSFVGPNGHIADMNGFIQSLQSWRGDRPDFNYDATSDESRQQQRGDWRTSLQDWRSQRPKMGGFMGNVPSINGYLNGGGVMTPGGGTTGAPLPGTPAPLPPTSVGMVPGVPGGMATNPGTGSIMTPGGGTTGAPLQAKTIADWRSPRRGF